jgi:nicotinamide N-methyltransferase
MQYFLAPAPSARILVIAGFHTGRAKLAAFFENAVPDSGLEVEEIFELDADGRRRVWQSHAVEEAVGERKKWLVVARLKRNMAEDGHMQGKA